MDGFGNRNSPRRKIIPQGFVFQSWLRQRPIPSPNRNTSFLLPSPESSRGLKACLALKYESPQIKKRKRLGDVPSFGLNTAVVSGS